MSRKAHTLWWFTVTVGGLKKRNGASALTVGMFEDKTRQITGQIYQRCHFSWRFHAACAAAEVREHLLQTTWLLFHKSHPLTRACQSHKNTDEWWQREGGLLFIAAVNPLSLTSPTHSSRPFLISRTLANPFASARPLTAVSCRTAVTDGRVRPLESRTQRRLCFSRREAAEEPVQTLWVQQSPTSLSVNKPTPPSPAQTRDGQHLKPIKHKSWLLHRWNWKPILTFRGSLINLFASLLPLSSHHFIPGNVVSVGKHFLPAFNFTVVCQKCSRRSLKKARLKLKSSPFKVEASSDVIVLVKKTSNSSF